MSIPQFEEREILRDLLDLDPNQPYLDWVEKEMPNPPGMKDDGDNDDLPNLVEMALATSPKQVSDPYSGTWEPSSTISWNPNEVAARYVRLIPQESADLIRWRNVPMDRISETSATMGAASNKIHFRLKALPR